MSGGTPRRGINSVHQGAFGEAWVQAVAAGCGFLQGPPATLDLQKADLQLTMQGTVGAALDPTVQVQVKTSEDAINDDGVAASYAVDRDTYDALRVTNRVVRRVLAVVWLERDGDRVRLEADGTLLVGRAAWVSLEGMPATQNAASVTVSVPLANTIDAPGLLLMLQQYGVPRSTSVPAVDPWSDP